MQHLVRTRLIATALLALFALIASFGPVSAATTGSISGTITDATTNKPVAGAAVVAASPSGRGTATTDANGFYNIYNLAPDTYTVSVAVKGYNQVVVNGVTVVQDQNVKLDQVLTRALQQIGRTSARSGSNLVQPSQTADVYNVSPQQLTAAAGIGGHRTLYDVIQTSAGVTSTGVAGRPRIRGSDVGDVAWEFDGIPINDRLTGLFTTNLSIVGTQNVEVYTGGYSAQYGNAGAGIINTVVKRGTYPASGSLTYTMQQPNSEHDIVAEYGSATPDNKWSWYGSLDYSNSDPVQFTQYQPFINAISNGLSDSFPSTIYSRDFVGNFHWRPSGKDDVQLLLQSGNLKLPWDQALSPNAMGVKLCNGTVVQPGTLVVTNPGVSDSGIPCVTASGHNGMQYTPVTQQNANVWYHWSNLGKIQWNHVFTDKLFAQLRFAENFNQYIFYQPVDTANVSGAIKAGTPFDWSKSSGTQDEYSDRRSQMYIGQLDLNWTPSARSTVYGGLVYERDNDAEHYYDFCGCDDGFQLGTPWNLDGTWPQLFLAVDYPLILPSVYAGTKQTFGKLVVEPSLRFDSETYVIPNRPDVHNANGTITKSYAYGPYSTKAWEPRFAFSWSPNSSSAIRGSYGVTSSFVPAAYVFNNSPDGVQAQDARIVSVYYPGAGVVPERNYNADLSFEKSLPNGIDSYRVSPFYRHSTNKLESVRQYVVNPNNTITTKGPSFFRTGIENKATGFEFAWNHVLPNGRDGLSWYFDGTYVNYWGSVTSGTLAGGTPYGSITSSGSYLAAFLATGTLFRNSSQPPWSIAWTGDYRQGRFHADPFVIYQVGAPYNVTGSTCIDMELVNGKSTCVSTDTAVHFSRAMYWTALDIGYDIVKHGKRVVTAGFNVRNLLQNNQGDVFAATNGNYAAHKPNPDLNAYGPHSVPNTLYYYSPDQGPRQVQLYFQTKF
ncbi:MAG: TonB-dependent receptor [Candidatus Eremiobacteraeota bacterium]|nr:TonB-dependent receptor [Candidatus Eremiobacteraeota bacterium]